MSMRRPGSRPHRSTLARRILRPPRSRPRLPALPLLSGLAEFDKIDGKMQAKIAARSGGGSQRAIMSNLSGTAFVIFQDGQIRGLNVALMIRQLTASTLSGWQEQKEQ